MKNIDVVEIQRIEEETPSIKSFYFDWDKDSNPGQFVMIWVPGQDEFPMALSRIGDTKSITVKEVGEGTSTLHEMKQGDRIGIRGPYGNGYTVSGENIVVVIGGYAASSVYPVIVEAAEKGKDVKCIMGAQSDYELLFRDELDDLTELHICTDDGSAGHEGFTTDLIEEVIDENTDLVLTCGPEVMMKKVVDFSVSSDIPAQASLERYMKCGLGLCDSCSINGFQVCKDGPVFDGETLKKMDEFGRFERDETGKKVEF